MKKLALVLILSALVTNTALAQFTCKDANGNGSYPFCAKEDVAETAAQNLLAVGTVRRDTAAASAGTTGDNATLNTDATGRLWVNVVGTGAAGDLTKVEDAGHTSGDSGVMLLGVQNTNLSGTLCASDKDYCPIATSTAGGIYIIGNVQEDLASGSAHPLVPISAVRDDALTAGQNLGDGGDYGYVYTDNYGSLWTHPVKTSSTLTDAATADTNAYAAGDCLEAAAVALTGTAATAPFLSGTIKNVIVTDLADQSANLDVVFFNADPGAVCASINSAFDLADDDVGKYIGAIHVTDHISLADNSVSQGAGDLKYSLASGTALYYAVIVRGAPTYAASDLTFKVVVELD